MKQERKYLAIYDNGDQSHNELTYWSISRNNSKANLEDAYSAMKRKFGNRGGGTIQFTTLDN